MFEGTGQQHAMERAPLRISFDAEDAVSYLSVGLDDALRTAGHRPIVIVCVGTDRSTGDAFGPIVGSRLAEHPHHSRIHIYGTLENPVHAVNLAQTLDTIRQQCGQDAFILAIDACLGRFEHVGQIILEEGPLRPGAGVKKALPEFGHYTLTGVVNVSGFMEYFVLQNTRLGVVMKMTDIVVQGLLASLYRVPAIPIYPQYAEQPGSI